ncbi:hypothetical protein [Ruegeria sp. ANG-R]|uniref:hypothetical protein n=1 Tax=Ruegeria sp. ANG-R TaxID=1577903 RepID=UPI00068F298B|nr:hypothetical protein [Ruegeria sp. ANG-R]
MTGSVGAPARRCQADDPCYVSDFVFVAGIAGGLDGARARRGSGLACPVDAVAVAFCGSAFAGAGLDEAALAVTGFGAAALTGAALGAAGLAGAGCTAFAAGLGAVTGFGAPEEVFALVAGSGFTAATALGPVAMGLTGTFAGVALGVGLIAGAAVPTAGFAFAAVLGFGAALGRAATAFGLEAGLARFATAGFDGAALRAAGASVVVSPCSGAIGNSNAARVMICMISSWLTTA